MTPSPPLALCNHSNKNGCSIVMTIFLSMYIIQQRIIKIFRNSVLKLGGDLGTPQVSPRDCPDSRRWMCTSDLLTLLQLYCVEGLMNYRTDKATC